MAKPWEKYQEQDIKQPEAMSGPWDQYAEVKGEAPKEELSTFGKVLRVFDYPGRIARTAIAAAGSEDVGAGDVLEQAKHLYTPQEKDAPTGQDLMNIYPGVKKALIGMDPMSKEYEDSIRAIKDPQLRESQLAKLDALKKSRPDYRKLETAAGIGAEVLTDPTLYLSMSDVAKGVGGIFKAPVDGASAGAKQAGKQLVSTGEKIVAKGTEVGTQKLVKLAEGAANISNEQQSLAKSVIKASGEAVLDTLKRSKPTLNPRIGKIAETAKKIGMKLDDLPDTAIYGADSDIANQYKVLTQITGGEPLRVAHQEVLDKVRNGLDDVSSSISKGRVAQIQDEVTAGKKLVEDFQGAQDAIRKKIDWDRSMVYKNLSGGDKRVRVPMPEDIRLSMVESLEAKSKKALRRAKRAGSSEIKSQMENIAQIAQDAADSVKKVDLKKLHEYMQDFGSDAFKQERIAKETQKAYADIYFTMAEHYDDAAKVYLGDDISKRIEEGNKLWTEFYRSPDNFLETLTVEADPEKIYKAVIKNSGSNQLEKYVDFMAKNNPDGLDNARSLFASDLIQSAQNQKQYGFENLLSQLDDPRKSWRIEKFLGKEKMSELRDIAELGRDVGSININPSGTARMEATLQTVKTATDKVKVSAMREALKKRVVSEGVDPDILRQLGIEMPKNLNQAIDAVGQVSAAPDIAGPIDTAASVTVRNALRSAKKLDPRLMPPPGMNETGFKLFLRGANISKDKEKEKFLRGNK
jgi:hypothetical protein